LLLFGEVKQQLSGCLFDDADDLPTAVQEIMDDPEKPTLIRVFHKWVRRQEPHIQTQGKHVG
jgi:hypothetical protein